MDYLQPDHPYGRIIQQYSMRNLPIFAFTHSSMATKEQAKKSVRATHKRAISKQIYLMDVLSIQLSGKRANVFVHKDKQNVIPAYRGIWGWTDKWVEIAAIGRERKQTKRFQYAQQSRIVCLSPCSDHSRGTFAGRALTQDTKRSDKQITSSKATSVARCVV
jgi:hypothetical protein